MKKLAFIFPGQGSQRVGMGKSLAENYAVAARIFQEADEILGINLSQLCFEGPEEKLRRTEYTQVAVLTCSVATLRVLQEKGLLYEVVAGHSLGEYSALIACCSLSFEDGLKLVQHRATFMEEASQKQASGMIAVLGLDAPKLTAICEEVSGTNGVVQIANYNCPGQLVIAGGTKALEKAIALAEASKAKCRTLPVNGAFHSDLMKPAAENLKKVIKDFSISKPEIKFIANVTGDYIHKPGQIREILIAQVTSPVQWEASVRLMINSGVTTFIEVGPGKVLSGLVRRIDGKVETLNVETSADVENVLSKT
ncbi:ACP S-malonyltransferase [Candidatus Poribacteria bacterium]|nr:ACP S-malonyltransferase [Candidatus Poribacteria bacterium]